jgi:FMN phosphatase YigB (HAD superfamily)
VTVAVPTLLVDVGGTLLVRDRPGPFTAATQILAELGVDLSGERRLTLARALLTGADRAASVDLAAEQLGLAAAERSVLGIALTAPPGRATLTTGAVTLLRTAADSGWRTVAVTNAARWSDPLPPELDRQVAQVVSSADVGHIKQEDAFWDEVARRTGATAARGLVVGDSPGADAVAPARQGFCAVLVGERGPHQLDDVARWLPTAGAPPADVIGLAVGLPALWAGRPVLDVPHLHGLVTATTQTRVRLTPAPPSGAAGVVVRRRYMPPALTVPELSPDGCLLWLLAVEDRRNVRLPADLAESLDRLGLSLDSIPNRDRRHLVSLVREAHNQETRQQRRDDIIRFLQRGPSSGSAP